MMRLDDWDWYHFQLGLTWVCLDGRELVQAMNRMTPSAWWRSAGVV